MNNNMEFETNTIITNICASMMKGRKILLYMPVKKVVCPIKYIQTELQTQTQNISQPQHEGEKTETLQGFR